MVPDQLQFERLVSQIHNRLLHYGQDLYGRQVSQVDWVVSSAPLAPRNVAADCHHLWPMDSDEHSCDSQLALDQSSGHLAELCTSVPSPISTHQDISC